MIGGLIFLPLYWYDVYTGGFLSFIPTPIGFLLTLLYIFIVIIEGNEGSPGVVEEFKSSSGGCLTIFLAIMGGLMLGLFL